MSEFAKKVTDEVKFTSLFSCSQDQLTCLGFIIDRHLAERDKAIAKGLVEKYGAYERFNDRGYLGLCVSMHWDTEGSVYERNGRLRQKLVPALTTAIESVEVE